MKTKSFCLFILALILNSCGKDYDCKAYIQGVCIVDSIEYKTLENQDYLPLDYEDIMQTLKITSEGLQEFFPEYNIFQDFNNHDLVIEFINPIEGNKRSGFYREGEYIQIEFYGICYDEYRVLNHELLHYFSEQYLGISVEEQMEHDFTAAGVYMYCSSNAKVQTDEECVKTIQYQTVMNVFEHCKEKYPLY